MNKFTTTIEPKRGFVRLDLHELYEYRDLFFFLVWRDIKAQYAQSVLGVGWAIIQPLFTMIVFTVVFGKLASVPSDDAPYEIFSFVALIPWTYFQTSLTASSASLVTGSNILTKIYFPRLILPITSVLGKLVGFGISFIILVFMMIIYSIVPTVWILVLPILILMMVMTSVGFGMWFSAMAIQFRDVKHAMTFGAQLLMYASPVVYPASLVPEQYRIFYALNPMVGVIEGFRSAIIGTNPMPWDLIAVGALTALIIFFSGIVYFKRMEKIFADVA
jgi:lipopolysaccharide transport system permease protein